MDDDWMAIYQGDLLLCYHPFSTPEEISIVMGCARYYTFVCSMPELRMVRQSPNKIDRVCERAS